MRAIVPQEPRGLYDMLRYHLGWVDEKGAPVEGASAGKALRPTLCFLTCEALGAPCAHAATAAATLELVHNFSLVHDDIQDGDKERRGRPTVWSLWGVGRGVWAGNAMRVVADRALASGSPPMAQRKQAALLLTRAYLEMIEGQYQDLEFEGRGEIATGEYLEMISRKTGALILCAVELGAMAAEWGGRDGGALRLWGTHLGRAFQVRDDILGIWGNPTVTGKPIGNDIRRKKKTFPVVLAYERAQGAAKHALLEAYGSPELSEAQVERVLDVLEELEVGTASQALVERETEQALESLQRVGPLLFPWAHGQMVQLTEFLAHRDR